MLKMISFKAVLLLYLATFVCGKEDDILDINDDQWKNLLKGEWMIEFHSSWCPACRTLQPVWEDLGSRSDDLGIKVAKVDVTDAPGISARFYIVKPPRIFHAIDGEFREYEGPRGKDDLITFIEEKKWKEIEPLSLWKEPDSLWRTAIIYYFKMSVFLWRAYLYLTEYMGVPHLVGCCVFVVLSVIFGEIIGSIIIFFNDHVYLPKTEPNKKAKSDDENDNEHEDKNDVVAEAAEKRDAEEFAKRDSRSDSGVEETDSPRSLRKRKSRKV